MSFVTASSVITSKSWLHGQQNSLLQMDCDSKLYSFDLLMLDTKAPCHNTYTHFIFILSFMPICYPIMDKRAIILLSLNFTIGLSLIYIRGFKSLVSTYIGGHLGRLPDLINPLLPLLFIYSFDFIQSMCILKEFTLCVCA